jgi:hypothetical protein
LNIQRSRKGEAEQRQQPRLGRAASMQLHELGLFGQRRDEAGFALVFQRDRRGCGGYVGAREGKCWLGCALSKRWPTHCRLPSRGTHCLAAARGEHGQEERDKK